MNLVILFLLFLSFIAVYKYDRTFFYIYSILFPFVGFFLLNKIGYNLAYTVINVELIAFIVLACTHKFPQNINKYIIIYLTVYLTYFLLISTLQNVPFLSRWNHYKSPLVYFMWACMLLEDIKGNNVSVKKLQRFFYSFLIFELVLCILQYTFEPIRFFFRNVNYIGPNGEIIEIRDDFYGGLMCGTFINVTTVSNILLMCFVICSNYILSRNFINQKSLFLIITTLLVIMLSGIKATFLLAVTFFIIIVFKYKQFKMLYVVAVFAIAIILSGVVGMANGDTVSFGSGGIARSLSIFSITDQTYIREQTTLSMSFSMFPYVLKNPLFGIGNHYKRGYLIEGTNFSIEDFSTTDAMLFFEIAEIGIIGLLIYLWPLLKFMFLSKTIKVKYSQYRLLFVLLILSTIVDAGFKSNNLLLLFFFSAVLFMESPISSIKNINYE